MSAPSNGSTVLVTGASGFTGRYVADRLRERGYRVVRLAARPAADACVCDITDRGQVAAMMAELRPDYLVHLAAIAFVAHADVEQMYRVNLFGTLNLLQGLADAGVSPRKVIVASSANVYGNPPVERVSEAVCPAPLNHYANSKLAMEHMVRTWFDRFPILLTRPFNYTGVGQDEKFLVPKIVGHFRRKEALIKLGNLDVVREFNDVRFVAEAYCRLLESDAASETVNLCTGQGYPLLELLERLQALSGHRLQVEVAAELVRQNELKVLIGDDGKLRRLLGDDMPRYRLEDTLDWMLGAPA